MRNVGFAYPWMRPSVEFYGWMPASTLDGADVSRQWQLGDVRVRAKAFAGRTSVTFGSTQDNGDTHGNIRPLMGGTLAVDSNGFTLKATVAEARTIPRNDGAVTQSWNALDALSHVPVPVVATQAAQIRDSYPPYVFVTRYAALGASWDSHPWQLQAEISRITGNFESSSSWYAYASAARRFDSVTLFAMAGRARASREPLPEPQWTAALTPVIGPALAAQAQYLGSDIAAQYNLSRIDQSSASFGARWDINAQFALKAQFDTIHSGRYGGGMWTHDTSQPHQSCVLSTGLDFVF